MLKAPVKQCTDAELLKAYTALTTMENNHRKKQQHPKYIKKFQNQLPPKLNIAFTNLHNEILNELNVRKISHA